MVYIPGLEGTGIGACSQFEGLGKYFDLVALNIPVGDRSTFAELVDMIALFMEEQRAARGCGAKGGGAAAAAEVYLMGESMGGLLALGVAQARPHLVVRPYLYHLR